MYRAPVDEIAFTLKHVAGMQAALEAGVLGDLSEDLVDAILAEAGRFATEEVAPLRAVGDRQGAVLEDAAVRMPDGWKELYRRWIDGGWNALSARSNSAARACRPCWRRGAGNVELRLDGFRHRTDADHGRGRSAGKARLGRAEGDRIWRSWSPASGWAR